MVSCITDISHQNPLTSLLTLTSLMPLVFFYSPGKHQETSDFQRVEKVTSGMECVNPCVSFYL